MVPYHSCHETRRRKELKGIFNVIRGKRSKPVNKGVSVFMRGVDSSRDH